MGCKPLAVFLVFSIWLLPVTGLPIHKVGQLRASEEVVATATATPSAQSLNAVQARGAACGRVAELEVQLKAEREAKNAMSVRLATLELRNQELEFELKRKLLNRKAQSKVVVDSQGQLVENAASESQGTFKESVSTKDEFVSTVEQSTEASWSKVSGIVCGKNKFCLGWEGSNIYCYGDSNGCRWSSNDCHENADCSKYNSGGLKFTDGDSPACPVDGWKSDACVRAEPDETTYVTYYDKNAYKGFGAEEIDVSGTKMTALQCQQSCTNDASCECVTFFRANGKCYRRRACDPSRMTSPHNYGYNVYMKAVTCFETGIVYEPVDMSGHTKTDESSALECQKRCASVSGCAHFSFWSDGGCHLQSNAATSVLDPWANEAKYLGDSEAGPPTCFQGETCGDHCAAGNCVVSATGNAMASTCTVCKDGYYRSSDGNCVERCPLGYEEIEHIDGTRECQLCLGNSRRREANKRTQCKGCPNGEIAKPDHDECQSIQDTCSQEQCEACAACFEDSQPRVAKCVQKKDPHATCLFPGNLWCDQLHTKCQSLSYGCFFKLRCQSPCICDSWKSINCGSKHVPENAQKCRELAAPQLLEGAVFSNESSAMGQRSAHIDSASTRQSLDAAVAGKCG